MFACADTVHKKRTQTAVADNELTSERFLFTRKLPREAELAAYQLTHTHTHAQLENHLSKTHKQNTCVCADILDKIETWIHLLNRED